MILSTYSAHSFFGDPKKFSVSGKNDDILYIDYAQFGEFENVGTDKYRYDILDRQGLEEIVGIGIYPNVSLVRKQRKYKRLVKSKKLEGPLKKFVPEADPQLAFYKWAHHRPISKQGLRYFNMAKSLELGGHKKHALKAYYSIVVHFPKEVVWHGGTPWYIGVTALDEVYRLLSQHPEWDLSLQGAHIQVKNGFDTKGVNDVFIVNPGYWVKGSQPELKLAGYTEKKKNKFGNGDIELFQRENGHWQLNVEGLPYFVRGMCYTPSPVGTGPDWGDYKPHWDWMGYDSNENGKIDAPYESWVDRNRNNVREKNSEFVVGDFQLMMEMGVNTLRLYHHGKNRELLRDLKSVYGIRIVMGDLLGAYTVGSDAAWEDGTDYTNPDHLEAMTRSVEDMVLTHKDEDYVLMWALGNENNYGIGNNANKKPQAYYKFVNEMAELIHNLDSTRPVVLVNGDLGNLELISEICPQVNVLGVNAYRGPYGMGESFWRSLHAIWKKPVLITEFGCPAYNKAGDQKRAEEDQTKYLLANWKDIMAHSVGYGTGNAIGGMVFEWVDEWWKAGSEYEIWIQDTVPQFSGPFPDGNMYEEWLGVTSQGNGEDTPFIRQLRPAYHAFKNGPWKEPWTLSYGTKRKK